MNRKKLSIGIVLLFSFFIIVYANPSIIQNTSNFIVNISASDNKVSYTTNEMNNSLTEENITFSGTESHLRWITVPKNSTVKKAEFNVSGYIYNFSRPYYNETACSGTCYFNNLEYAYDNGKNDTSTYAEVNLSTSTLFSSLIYWFKLGEKKPATIFYTWNSTKYDTDNSDIRLWNFTGGKWTTLNSMTNTTITTSSYYLYPDHMNDTGHVEINFLVDFGKGNIYIWDIHISNVTDGYPSNVSIDIGDDGDKDWSVSGLNNTNSPQQVSNISEFNNFLSTCPSDVNGNCNIVINVTATDGSVEISNINITYDYNITYLFSVSDYKWDTYTDIVANSTVNKTKWINNTAHLASNQINVTGYYVNGTSCQVNDVGYNVIFDTSSSSFCYQESANVSSTCGGLSTGSYSYTWSGLYGGDQVIDGDWNTHGTPGIGEEGSVYINYTKPSNAQNSSLWQVKDSGGTVNLTIPLSCWNQGVLQFRMRSSNTEHAIEYCYNGTDWDLLRDIIAGKSLYEDAMWWNISSIYCNYTHTINQGSSYPDLEFEDSGFGTGMPIVQINDTPVQTASTWVANSTIYWYLPNNTEAGAGTFTNSTFNLTLDDTQVTGSEYIKTLISSTWHDLTPTSAGVFEKKEPVASYVYYVRKLDENSDGVYEKYTCIVESNKA